MDYVSTTRRHLGRVKPSLKYALCRGKKDVENELGNTGHTTSAAVGSIAKDQQLKGFHRGGVEGLRRLG
jgi:hypothetical protein